MPTKIDVKTEYRLFYKAQKIVYSITHVYYDSQYIVSNVKSTKGY